MALSVLGVLSALSGGACNGRISGGEGVTGQGNTGAGASSTGSGSAGTTGSGHGGSGVGAGTGSGLGTGTGGTDVLRCNTISPGRAPLRRLTTYEYNNTIHDLLGDTTSPGSALPPR